MPLTIGHFTDAIWLWNFELHLLNVFLIEVVLTGKCTELSLVGKTVIYLLKSPLKSNYGKTYIFSYLERSDSIWVWMPETKGFQNGKLSFWIKIWPSALHIVFRAQQKAASVKAETGNRESLSLCMYFFP